MFEAKRGYASIMNPRPGDLSCSRERAELTPVLVRFRQQNERWRLQPRGHLFEGGGGWSWRIINTGMRDDGEKLVQARPWNSPSGAAFR